MRALIAALALVTAPALIAPDVAFADGIERPRPPRRRRPPPPPPPQRAPEPAIVIEGPETVTLSNDFFAGSAGGVGANIDGGGVYSSTVIIRGGSAHASAFAYASARASARSGGRGRGGGHGCSCH